MAQFVPTHIPTILTKAIPAADSRPTDQEFDLSPLPKWHLWHPVRERMQFRFDGDGRPGALTYESVNTATPSAAGKSTAGGGISVFGSNPILALGDVTIRRIGDVPDSREIWPDRAKLDAESLSPQPPEAVAAQVFVPRGHVSGGGIGEKGKGFEVEFTPRKPRSLPDFQTIVPNVVVTVEASRVEIMSHSLDTGDELDPLVFDLSGPTEIWVSNGDPTTVSTTFSILWRLLQSEEGKAALSAFFNGQAVDLDPAFNALDPAFRAWVSQRMRTTPYDIDFEFFYTILGGTDDARGLPIPKKAQGEFDDQNCYCILACPPDSPTPT